MNNCVLCGHENKVAFVKELEVPVPRCSISKFGSKNGAMVSTSGDLQLVKIGETLDCLGNSAWVNIRSYVEDPCALGATFVNHEHARLLIRHPPTDMHMDAYGDTFPSHADI